MPVLLGARQVIAIDNVPERLAMTQAGGATTIDFSEESIVERLDLTHRGRGGYGPIGPPTCHPKSRSWVTTYQTRRPRSLLPWPYATFHGFRTHQAPAPRAVIMHCS